ncbi:hypothetical protein [Caldilinea sp.]|uniref:hypothetical protein n=1 Tax=Caldilinea sp. TaxID=2293560 RepID=UPI0025839C10|nr:hypothetical protein [Caldilinea sp.]
MDEVVWDGLRKFKGRWIFWREVGYSGRVLPDGTAERQVRIACGRVKRKQGDRLITEANDRVSVADAWLLVGDSNPVTWWPRADWGDWERLDRGEAVRLFETIAIQA